ncbi:four helix bundle protein [Barnesiella intestinihominis]|uniref:four helix bundle protein n=1 Tax=Barnesiella intestinihominis TaxID=487174 RepID=UPI003AF96BAD
MANYDNLPVYKAAYDLLLRVYGLGQHWGRDIKFTLGERLKNDLYDVLLFIYQANGVHEKSALIEQARLGITRVKIEIRLLHDLKQLSVKQYAVLSQMSESVSKQLAAWSKSQKNKVKPNSD